MARDGPPGSCGKKALNHEIFIVGFLQFVERQHLHSALCSTGCRAPTAQTVQAAVHECYRQDPQRMVLWGHPEAPKEMAAIYNLGGEYVDLAVVWYSAWRWKNCRKWVKFESFPTTCRSIRSVVPHIIIDYYVFIHYSGRKH
jgi:hypothetical protein